MEHRDISSTMSELETGEISTSLATDLSISAEDESETERRRDRKGFANKQSKVTKQLIERKQMMHDLQLIKIELSQKNLIIDNMKMDHVSKMEELQERLADLSHQKHILQVISSLCCGDYCFVNNSDLLTPSLRRPYIHAIFFSTACRTACKHAFRFLRVLPEAVSTRHSWL